MRLSGQARVPAGLCMNMYSCLYGTLHVQYVRQCPRDADLEGLELDGGTPVFGLGWVWVRVRIRMEYTTSMEQSAGCSCSRSCSRSVIWCSMELMAVAPNRSSLIASTRACISISLFTVFAHSFDYFRRYTGTLSDPTPEGMRMRGVHAGVRRPPSSGMHAWKPAQICIPTLLCTGDELCQCNYGLSSPGVGISKSRICLMCICLSDSSFLPSCLLSDSKC
ncbi:hypothetical protein DENSPDRAFT_404302 [Dentipellis sp. KUC8613]|nr:hypothetical protein DENSPDRAFT_404302 [Dentipellis sp. KUC8613]